MNVHQVNFALNSTQQHIKSDIGHRNLSRQSQSGLLATGLPSQGLILNKFLCSDF